MPYAIKYKNRDRWLKNKQNMNIDIVECMFFFLLSPLFTLSPTEESFLFLKATNRLNIGRKTVQKSGSTLATHLSN